MDAVTLPAAPEPRSAEIIDLAEHRRRRALAAGASPPAARDLYPWAYTFEAEPPEAG